MAWKPAYATTEAMKAFLDIKNGDSVDDTYLDLAVEAASRAIDVSCNRQFGVVSVAEERFYTARFDLENRRWYVPIDDLMTVTSFAAEVQDVDGNTVGAIDSYVMEPRNGLQTGRPWTTLMVRPGSAASPTGRKDEVAITALWGWTSVPETIKQATLLQASRFHARRFSPYGVAGSPDLGSELRLLAKLDVDVALMVNPYRRWWGAA